MTTEKMLSRVEEGVGYITFNNPEKHNAVSIEMWDALEKILDEFRSSKEIRVIVLNGAGGKSFVSGADISKFDKERSSKEAVLSYNKRTQKVYELLETFPKPTIAMIDGYCIGGGLNLAVCCDIRICSEKSKFAMPAAKLSLGYPFSSIKLVSAENIETYVRDYALTISHNAPLTIKAMKQIGIEILKNPDERDLLLCEQLATACFDSEDYKEGRKAFMEKRKPNFKGL